MSEGWAASKGFRIRNTRAGIILEALSHDSINKWNQKLTSEVYLCHKSYLVISTLTYVRNATSG